MSVAKLFIPSQYVRDGYQGHAIESRPSGATAASSETSNPPAKTTASDATAESTSANGAARAYAFQSLIRGTGAR